MITQSFIENCSFPMLVKQLTDILAQISDRKSRKTNLDDDITVRDILLICVYVFSLVGTRGDFFIDEYVQILKKSVVDSMVAGVKRVKRDNVEAWVDKAFVQLIQAVRIRDTCIFSNLLGSIEEDCYDPLVLQVSRLACQRVMTGNIQTEEIPQYSSQTGSTFSRFIPLTFKKRRISDFDDVIFVVIGGITFRESDSIIETFKKAGKNCIVLSDTITTRSLTYSRIFKK